MTSEEMRIKYWEQSIQFKSNFNSYQPILAIKQLQKLLKIKRKAIALLRI